MTDWIKCEDELPPCDGDYEVCEEEYPQYPLVASYDGFGFKLHYPAVGLFIIKYWRHIVYDKKKYGKQK